MWWRVKVVHRDDDGAVVVLPSHVRTTLKKAQAVTAQKAAANPKAPRLVPALASQS
jgi:hypothetical protein